MDMGAQFHSDEMNDIYRSELNQSTLRGVRAVQDTGHYYRTPTNSDFVDGMLHAAISGVMTSHRASVKRLDSGQHPMDVISQHNRQINTTHGRMRDGFLND